MAKRWEETINEEDGFVPQNLSQAGKSNSRFIRHVNIQSKQQVFCCILPSLSEFNGEPGIYIAKNTLRCESFVMTWLSLTLLNVSSPRPECRE